jgi:hypothetical protein
MTFFRAALWIVLVTLAAELRSAPAKAADCASVEANADVVEISRDGKNRHASGILITFDGYVLTAAHPIMEGLQPPYPIAVYVRQASSAWQSATVSRIDPTLDLALLKLERRPDNFAPLRVADVRDYASKATQICLSGFGFYDDARGVRFENKFNSIQAQTQGMQLGYYFANAQVPLGYSGGAAFIDGEMAGVILRRSDSGSFIVPISYVADFLIAQGIFLRAERSFETGTQWSQLPQLVENNRLNIEQNRREIQKILRSIDWQVELRSQGSDYVIVFIPKPVFPDQVVEGTFIGRLLPSFEHNGFKQWLLSNEPESIEIGGSLKKGVIEIPDVLEKIALLKRIIKSKSQNKVDVSTAKLIKIDIVGSILFNEFDGPKITKELRVPGQ